MNVKEVNAPEIVGPLETVDYGFPTVPVGMSSAVDFAERRYAATRADHWDDVARWMDTHRGLGGTYQCRLASLYRFFVPEGSRVLEIGCARGDLLAALKPSRGVGIDFSNEMISRARQRHPEMHFIHGDAHALEIAEEFDFIILSDLVNDLWDAQNVFAQIRKLATPRTRIILNFYNRLWELPLAAARRMGLARRNLYQNWFTAEDVTGLLELADFEVIRHRSEILLPMPFPLVRQFADRYLAKIWPFSAMALTHILVGRPLQSRSPQIEFDESPSVSVVVAA